MCAKFDKMMSSPYKASDKDDGMNVYRTWGKRFVYIRDDFGLCAFALAMVVEGNRDTALIQKQYVLSIVCQKNSNLIRFTVLRIRRCIVHEELDK